MILKSLNPVRSLISFLLILVFFSLSGFLDAKNRVNYTVYDWQVLKTPHFDIYYNKGNESLARYAGVIAEYSHTHISANLKFELTHIIPIFIYNGHNDFESTTISYETLPEGVEGFTEIFKNRVVIPFPGSYDEFRHVLMHELTHAFEYNILYGDFWESLLMRPFMFSPPLWFMEGMAEYESMGKDVTTDSIIRDAVLNKMMPTLLEMDDVGSLSPYKYYFVYKGGQEFFNYISDKYGVSKPGELLKHFRLSKDMNATMNSVLGKGMEDLSKEWALYLEKKYYPDVSHKEVWDKKYTFITHHFEDNSFRNTKPVFTRDGKKILFFTDGRLMQEIVSVDLNDPTMRESLVKGSISEKFEELHSEDNKLSVSMDNRYLLFVSKSAAYDRIEVYDLKKKKLRKTLTPKMDRIISASFSPKGDEAVFAGVKDGKTDLYIITIANGKIHRLTNDLFIDYMPFWASDGKIYFVSNRAKSIWAKQYDLFSFDPANDRISTVVAGSNIDIMPELSPDGKKLAFVSFRNGTPNIFIRIMTNGRTYQLTDVIGGAYDPSWSPDGSKLVFAFYNRLGQDPCIINFTNSSPIEKPLITDFASATNYPREMPSSIYDPRKDKLDRAKVLFSPDFVNMYLGFSTYSSFFGTFYLEASDMIGSHRFLLDSNFYTGQTNVNFNLYYIYQKHRLNYVFGAYNQKYYYINWLDDQHLTYDLYFKRETGVFGEVVYPFSGFTSMLAKVSYMNYGANYGANDNLAVTNNVTSDNIISSIGFEYNNLLYNGNYFLKGAYLGLMYDFAAPMGPTYWEYHRITVEARYYIPLSLNSSFGVRAEMGSILGRDAWQQPFYIGGLDPIRGYNYDVFSDPNMGTIKFEYRFPFVDMLRLAWPIPLIIHNLSGVLFWDFGAVWDNPDKTSFAHVSNDIMYFDAIKSGLGMGIRMNFFNYFKIIFDYASTYDGHSILPIDKWRGYLSIGYDF